MRLEDGDCAHRMLVGLLSESTLPNRFCNHPPFQIDGNFGGAAGIAEMLLQSRAGEIDLASCFAQSVAAGTCQGPSRAGGGLEVETAWADGGPVEAKLLANADATHMVRHGSNTVLFDVNQGERHIRGEDLVQRKI